MTPIHRVQHFAWFFHPSPCLIYLAVYSSQGKYAIQWMRKARLPSRPRTLVFSSARSGVCELCRVLLFVVVDCSVRVMCCLVVEFRRNLFLHRDFQFFWNSPLCFFSLFWGFFFIVYLNLSKFVLRPVSWGLEFCVAASLPLKEGFDLFQSIVDFSRWCWRWLSSQDALDGRIICWTCWCWRDLQYGRLEDILAVMYIKQVGYLISAWKCTCIITAASLSSGRVRIVFFATNLCLDQFVFSECELLRSTSEQRLTDLSQLFSIV